MKTQKSVLVTFGALWAFFGLQLAGCSSTPWSKEESGKAIAETGPTVLNAHVEPGTINLNRDLKTREENKVVADVKDFKSEVTDVTLRFNEVPITVPMKKMKGSTWVGELSPDQLRKLAVSGRSISYEAIVVAKNAAGKTSTSKEPLKITIKTPDVTQTG